MSSWIDIKLEEIRSYVNWAARQLASKEISSLKECFHNFLHRWEHMFTHVQRAHADQTLVLLLHNGAELSNLSVTSVLSGEGSAAAVNILLQPKERVQRISRMHLELNRVVF